MSIEERHARQIMLQEALAHLEAGRIADGESFAHIYDDLTHRYRHRLAALGGEVHDEDDHGHSAETYQRLQSIAESAVQSERRAMIRLRNEGRISDDILRKVERELDLSESRYQTLRLE